MSWTCTQDFRADLDGMICALENGEPFAMVRYGDGERAIIERRALQVNKYLEQWDSIGPGSEVFSERLEDSLWEDSPGWYVGISCPCCDIEAHRWALRKVGVPANQLTYANLIVNANWPHWMDTATQWWSGATRRAALVACDPQADYYVRPNAVNGFDALDALDELAAELSEEDRPIFVAAGPAAEVLIHRYWHITPIERRRPIIDIGSTFDVLLRGPGPLRRGYQSGAPEASKICQWS